MLAGNLGPPPVLEIDLPEMRGADNGLEDVRRVGSRLKRRGHSQKQATRGDQRCKRSNGVT